MLSKILAFFTAIIMFLFPSLNVPKAEADTDAWNTNYTCVFVHGLGGWGEYDASNIVMPYWGMKGGNLMKYLNGRGFDCHAASVNPSGSAWDRACELYAQLTGTVVDYGKEHSERCHHDRYGEDFSKKPLIKSFSAENKINLFGHSFGGATILMFLDLMADGSEAEREATGQQELSPLFEGGKADWIYSLTTLAAPMNGTTALNVADWVSGDPEATDAEMQVVDTLTALSFKTHDGRIIEDTAGYDMGIDAAQEMLAGFETQSGVYYFSVPCCASETNDGVTTLNGDIVESFYVLAGHRMARYTGQTAGGIVLDESWQPNDGLVNEKSAKAPFNAPQQDFDPDDIQPGIWNVYPTKTGDHMSLMGGLMLSYNIRPEYFEMLDTINRV
ncbi:MAG: hypothetical protein MJ177_04210 [Clostridia bacterium]|nr:hypothetical protein [Clostridia bacterium]